MGRRHASFRETAAEELLQCLVGATAKDLCVVELHLRTFRGIVGYELAEQLADFLEETRKESDS